MITEKNSRKVWVLHLCWKDKSLSDSYTVKDTRDDARSLKKNMSDLIRLGMLTISLHRGLQNTKTGALLVGQKKFY